MGSAMPITASGRYNILTCLEASHWSAHVATRPIEFTVVNVAFAFAKVGEQFTQVIIIWRFKKVQSTYITERVGFETLPREVTPEEIHEHVPKGLEVISPGLLLA